MTPVPLILSISIVYCTVHSAHSTSLITKSPDYFPHISQTISVLLIHFSIKTIWCAQYPLISHPHCLLNVCELNLPPSA